MAEMLETATLVRAAAPSEAVIDINPALAGINPTEVVALSGAEGLYEFSLPSGRVRVTDLGSGTLVETIDLADPAPTRSCPV